MKKFLPGLFVLLCLALSQTASAASISVSPTSLTYSATGGSQTFYVTTNVQCTVTTTASFLSLSTTTVPANSTWMVTVTAAANTGSARSGTITVKGGLFGTTKTVSVYQQDCPLKLQWYSQVNSQWSAAQLGTCSSTIGSSGCVISCGSMLLTSEVSGNADYTPATLNSWLKSNSGYSAGCDVIWTKIADADGSGGLTYVTSTGTANNWSWLDQQLNLCRKAIVRVLTPSGSTHYVVVKARVGSTGVASSYQVLDPGTTVYSTKTLANFNNTFYAGYAYSGTWGASFNYKDEEQEEIPYVPVLQNVVVVYPNPVSTGNDIHLRVTSMSLQQVQLAIYNMDGQLLSTKTEMAGEGVNEFYLDGMPSGFYLVRTAFEDGTAMTKRLIISN